MTTAERVALKRRQRSLIYKAKTAAGEIDQVLDRHYGRAWYWVKSGTVIITVIILCSLNIG